MSTFQLGLLNVNVNQSLLNDVIVALDAGVHACSETFTAKLLNIAFVFVCCVCTHE